MSRSNWSNTSPSSRGYGYAWTLTRKRILERDNGICQQCLKTGQVHAGNEVDHIVSKAEGKRLRMPSSQIESDGNLQTICKDAHKVKTLAEQGKTWKPKATIGIDGWPE